MSLAKTTILGMEQPSSVQNTRQAALVTPQRSCVSETAVMEASQACRESVRPHPRASSRTSPPVMARPSGMPQIVERPSTPPPAYHATHTPASPEQRDSGSHPWLDTLQRLRQRHAGMVPPDMTLPRPTARLADGPFRSVWSYRSTVADGDDRSNEESPIEMHIDASVHVTGDNNVVLMTELASSKVESIATVVVRALHDYSSGECGIPMVDEDGRPRPIVIKADAQMNIGGTGNLIANEAVIKEVFGKTITGKRRRADGPETHAEASRPLKRGRSRRE